jgi:DNA-binding transcriptional ArsR family regulator
VAESTDESLPYLRALGDPDRLKIVRLLREGPKTVSDICRALKSPMANVSHHLGLLKEAGIVSATKRGRFVFHQLNHLVESQLTGAHALDFGCCRIEFSDDKNDRSAHASDMEQALHILNEVLGKMPKRDDAPEKHSARDSSVLGEKIEIVNAEFASPATPFFDTAITGWQKEGDPAGTGVFRNFPDNTPLPGSRFVQDADGEQLATIGARQGLGLFQLIDKQTYQRGMTYTLTARVGVSSVQPPTSDGDIAPSLRLSLTSFDDAGTRLEVAGRSFAVNELNPDRSQLTDVSVSAPITTSSACADRRIGMLISTLDNTPNHGGHFIVGGISLVKSSH